MSLAQCDRTPTLEELQTAWHEAARYRLYKHLYVPEPLPGQKRWQTVYLGVTGLTYAQAKAETDRLNDLRPANERGFGGTLYCFELENEQEARAHRSKRLIEMCRLPPAQGRQNESADGCALA